MKHTSSFKIGDWQVVPETGVLQRKTQRVNIEPQVMDLLTVLCGRPGKVFSRKEIEAVLWPNTVVGEDSLPRTVSKLRQALGDSSSSPVYIQTIPKRGYRVIAKVYNDDKGSLVLISVIVASALMLAWFLLASQNHQAELPQQSENSKLLNRADNLYMRFTRADNEAAIALYERIIEDDSSNSRALAGLANSLVQRAVRWQNKPSQAQVDSPSLTRALRTGLTETPDGRATLSKAAALAERATRLSPNDPESLKALGLTYSAQGKLDRAAQIYIRAIDLDSEAWAPLINLGEIHSIQGDTSRSTQRFEEAYVVMDRVYELEPQKVGPWHAAVGVVVGDSHLTQGDSAKAEQWYRRVLEKTPYEPNATSRLVSLLSMTDRTDEAKDLCAALREKVSELSECQTIH